MNLSEMDPSIALGFLREDTFRPLAAFSLCSSDTPKLHGNWCCLKPRKYLIHIFLRTNLKNFSTARKSCVPDTDYTLNSIAWNTFIPQRPQPPKSAKTTAIHTLLKATTGPNLRAYKVGMTL